MLKLVWVILNIALISIIFIRTPNNGGLASLTTKTNLLGSPNSAEKFLNRLTWGLIISYFFLAVKFNLAF
nr:Preprotein translocase SecG subunit [Guinardia striata]